MPWSRRQLRWIAASAGAALALTACGNDDGSATAGDGEGDWPDGPLTLLVGFGAGGANDLIARRAAPLMSEILGVPIQVENLPGASGVVALQEMLNRDPDGMTMATYQSGTTAIGEAMEDLPFAADELELLGTMTADPVGIAVAMDSPYQDLTDVVEAANETHVTGGHMGFTQPDGVSTSLFELRNDVELTHVAYDSGGEQASALLGGHVDVGFRAGGYYDVAGEEVRVLAVMSPERVDALPDTPTVTEAIDVDLDLIVRRGFAVPADVPEERQQRLAEAFAEAAQDPRFSDGLVEDINLSYGYLSRDEAAEAERDLQSVITEVDEAGLLGNR